MHFTTVLMSVFSLLD